MPFPTTLGCNPRPMPIPATPNCNPRTCRSRVTDDTPDQATIFQWAGDPTNAQMLALIGIEPELFVKMVADGTCVEMEDDDETADGE